ncbi:ArsR/SmtB family transcription factor [Isoptericola sp. NPDC057191]|uniref:ArsR/SmtB family transcription factor n=1 Tax=Isoptericola sp. NPDC057191 TaxID=3346041 RepID=UPI00362CA5B4
MPKKIAPPADRPEEVEVAITVFGNEVKNEIVRCLAGFPEGAFLGDVVTRTALPRSTVAPHLAELEQLGVVGADIPPGQRQGRSVRYSVTRARVAELLTTWVTHTFGPGAVGYFLGGGYLGDHDDAPGAP